MARLRWKRPDPKKGIGPRRVMVPTALNMTIRIPTFQPANVNSGKRSFHDDRTGIDYNFGNSLLDVAGIEQGGVNTTKNTLSNAALVGPLDYNTGRPLVYSGVSNQILARKQFPAGGYLTEMLLLVNLPGSGNSNGAGVPNRNNGAGPLQAYFQDSTSDGLAGVRLPYRGVQVGLTVPPSIKMRVSESTIDLGKMPHGTGFSDTNGNAYRIPYAPVGVGPYVNPAGVLPWDSFIDSNGATVNGALGSFFRPFTLTSDSNINLLDLRIAKLAGVYNINNAAGQRDPIINQFSFNPLLGYGSADPGGSNRPLAKALTFASDQVSELFANRQPNPTLLFPAMSAAPYLGPGFTQGAGNIGLVSSFDHVSGNNNPGNPNPWFNETRLWPLTSSYVTAADITRATDPSNPTLLQFQINDGLPNNLQTWTGGFQPTPTLHKPQVGAGIGTTASIPDVPAGLTADVNARPRISIAVPPGTPSGTYSASIYPFEDNLPIQWVDWLNLSSSGAGLSKDHDGILNVTQAGAPSEGHPDTPFQFKYTVKEARLTEGVTEGTLGQIDLPGGNNNGDLLSGAGFVPFGANMLPAAARLRTNVAANPFPLFLYWTTNRQNAGSPFVVNNLPSPDSPFSLAFSSLPSVQENGFVDFRFGKPGTGNATADARWWSAPLNGNPAYGLFPDLTNNATLAALFPSSQAEAITANAPFQTGQRAPQTTRNYNPEVVQAINAQNPTGNAAFTTYLFWQGLVDKALQSGQVTETRTFYTSLDGNGNRGRSQHRQHSLAAQRSGPDETGSEAAAAQSRPERRRAEPVPVLVCRKSRSDRNLL